MGGESSSHSVSANTHLAKDGQHVASPPAVEASACLQPKPRCSEAQSSSLRAPHDPDGSSARYEPSSVINDQRNVPMIKSDVPSQVKALK